MLKYGGNNFHLIFLVIYPSPYLSLLDVFMHYNRRFLSLTISYELIINNEDFRKSNDLI